jgi:hypothetical protein
MLRRKDKNKVQLNLPTKEQVKERLEHYESDIIFDCESVYFDKNQQKFIFEDDMFSEELPKFKLNSVFISDGFEISEYQEHGKFFARLTSTKNGNMKLKEGHFESHFIELEFDTYEDFLTFCDSVYTRNGITQADGLDILSAVNSKSFFKKAATATAVAGGAFFLSKLINKIKK